MRCRRMTASFRNAGVNPGPPGSGTVSPGKGFGPRGARSSGWHSGKPHEIVVQMLDRYGCPNGASGIALTQGIARGLVQTPESHDVPGVELVSVRRGSE